MKQLIPKMTAVLSAAAGLGILMPQDASAYVIMLDMDVSTPVPGTGIAPPGGVSGFPAAPGAPDFMDPSIGVLSGATVTVIAYLIIDPGAPPPVVWDTVGVTLDFGFITDTVTSIIPGIPATVAGGTAALGMTPGPGTSLDILAGPVGPGVPLTPVPLLPASPFAAGSIGGGYFDPASAFSGFGIPGGTVGLEVFDILGMSFTVTGSPGDVATIAPAGIFAPGAPGPPPLFAGGDALYDAATGGTIPATGGFIPGTIMIVPEPGSSLLLSLGMLGVLIRRRR